MSELPGNDRPDAINESLASVSSPFIRRPIGTSLLAIGLFVLGAVCYSLLGVAALPNLEFPAVFVWAQQPGADAATMAATVASPLERHLGQIAGIDNMSSNSNEGTASVFVVFETKRHVDDAARDVQAAVNAASSDLPAGLKTSPQYFKANPNNAPALILALTSTTKTRSELYNYADSLIAQRVRQLPGVSDVEIAGGATPAIRVDVDLRALSARGLSSDDLRSALASANVTAPQGFINDGNTTMAIAANDALSTPDAFNDLVIANQGNTAVHLRDVATVYDGQEDRYQAAFFNSQRAILMLVRKRPDANVVSTVDSVKALMPELSRWLPGGVTLTPFQDRTPTIRSSVHEVQITLLISLTLVMATMLFFLRRLAPTLIASAAIPMSLAGAFIAMYLFHFTLDTFSLMALVLAIGFVVDDAIVVIENIVRHLDAGMPRMQATLLGAREIGFTVISITASLMAVFVPLMFADGLVGSILHEFGVTLTAAIAISAVVSLTLTPSLCGRFLKPHVETRSRIGDAIERFHAGMLETYRRALDWTLLHPWRMAVQPAVLLCVTIWLATLVTKGFFPQEDTGQLQGSLRTAPGASFDIQLQQLEQVTAILQRDPAVESIGARVGAGRGGGGNAGQLFINLKPLGKGRKESTFLVMNRLTDKTQNLSGAQLFLRPVQDLGAGGGNNAQYQYELTALDFAPLHQWTPKLVDALRKLPELRDVSPDIENDALRQNIVIDRDAASRLGISVAAINSALYDTFGQRQISTIYSDINQYKVVLTALPSQTATPDSLTHLYVRSQTGGMLPITAVARMQDGVSPKVIQHEGQFPVITLSFNLAPGIAMGTATAAIEKTMAALHMPADIHGAFGGDLKRFQTQQSNTPLLILAALLAVYLILGILYESLVHPLTILSTLPSAGVGALLALLITGTELSVVSVIAIILLIGIVKKNAIMMIDFALSAERAGAEPFEAIRQACLVRFRPIIMTSVVAIFGALPLALDFGTGSETRRPLGIAMVGGLLASQAITLLTTPAIYLLVARSAKRRRERRAIKKAKRQPLPTA
jgi:multidrug efflux pump